MGMGQHSCCNKQKVKRGLWSPEEDEKLINYISTYGHGCWSSVPRLAGLQRCGKSCRLRWINYLRPDLKRGCFSSEEATLIVKLHRILGNRWSQIAKQLPGRTDNEVKNFWNSSIKKKLFSEHGLISDHHHHQRHHHHPGAINASSSSSSIANNANHIVINRENQGLYATNPTNNYSDINNHLMIFPSDLLRHEDDNIHQLYVNSTHLMITAPTPPFAAVPPATINLQPSDQFVHQDQSNFDLHDHYIYNLNHPVPILPPVPTINSGQQYYSINRYEHHPWLQANFGGSNSLLSPAGIVDDHDQFMSTVVPSNAMMSSSRVIEEPNMIRDGVHGASRDTPPQDQMSQFIEAILQSSTTKVPSSLATSNMSSSSSSSLSPLSCTSAGQFLVHNINAGCTTLPSTSWDWDP